MNEVEELLGKENQNKSSKSNYDKEKWKETQNKKRKQANEIADTMSLRITTDGNLFKNYLDIQSRFSKYSVSNCLIVLKNNKNATQIKDKKSWEEKGYQVFEKEIEKPITILEPVKSKGGVTFYNPKDEYDISQTDAPIPEEKIYTTRELLRAILQTCKIEKQVVDMLDNGKLGVEYKKEENKLYMCRGMLPSKLLQGIMQQLANIQMQEITNSEMKEFKTYCVSYMLCKKYGIDILKFDFNELPDDIKSLSDGKTIRQELDSIKKVFESINNDISSYFIDIEKENKNKNQERG